MRIKLLGIARPERWASLVVLLSLLGQTQVSFSQQVIADWEAGTCPTGNWTEACWGAEPMPDNGNFGNTYHAVISDGIASVNLNINITLDLLTIFNSNLLTQDNNIDLAMVGGTVGGTTGVIAIDGQYVMDSTGSNTDLTFAGGDFLLIDSATPSGLLTMSAFTTNRIYDSDGTPTPLIVESPIRIEGAGQIGLNVTGLDNRGVIMAIHPGVLLTVDPSDLLATLNSGTLGAEAGATLLLAAATYDQSGGGEISADANSVVDYAPSVAIIGGTLTGAATGMHTMNAASVTLRDVTLAGASVVVGNNADPILQDSFTFLSTSSEFNVNSLGSNTDLIIDGVGTSGVQVTGGGSFNLSDQFQNRIYGLSGSEVLTLTNGTIRGSGQFGMNLLEIVNGANGRIVGDQSERLQVDPNAGGLLNLGLMRAELGGTLRLSGGTYDNTAGTIEARDGSTLEFYSADVDFGGGALSLLGSCPVNCDGAFALRNVTVTSDAGTLFTITGTGGVFEKFTFDAVMDQANNADVRWRDDIVNTGEINLLSGGSQTDVSIEGGLSNGAQLTGGGFINLSDNIQNRIYGVGGTVLENADNTIRGSGQLGLNLLTIENAGTILADQSTTLVIDPDAVGLTNDGTLRADGAGTLQLAAGVYTQTASGVISADNGGLVELSGPHIIGGTLDGAGGTFSVVANGTILEGISTDAVIDVQNNIDPTLRDGIVNSGQINLLSIGSNTDLIIRGNATNGVQLTGGGTINLSDDLQNRIYGFTTDTVLENIDNTIRGSGQFGLNLLGIDNQGTIIADQPTKLTLDPDASGFTSSGTIIVEPGSVLESADDMTQTAGRTTVRGMLDILNAKVFNLDGGILDGTGVVDGDVTNDGGAVQPGESAGQLTMQGSYLQTNGGTLDIELGGYLPITQHDRLVIDGGAMVGGTLNITFIDGFEPALGTVFTVLTADDVFGTFNTVNGSGQFTPLYSLHTVQIVVDSLMAPCAADIAPGSGDGQVNVTDLLALLSAWGPCPGCPADTNGDDNVNVTDLLDLLASWGACP